MSRTKEFDVDTALEAALELFQRQGYSRTSMNELVAHSGVAKASLYATFGAKHDLYRVALERYVELTNAKVIAELSGTGTALNAVRGLVHRYVDDLLGDRARIGCLVVNSATELLPADAEVERLIERSWDTLEMALTVTFSRAKAQGELTADSDPRGLAVLFLAFLQGVQVLGKGAHAERRLRTAAASVLRLLDA